MTGPDSGYQERLEEIAERHLSPDAGQKVDVWLRSQIMSRILRWVRGPDVLEMGAGEVMWTDELVERFGRSSIVDGSATLLDHACKKYGDRVTGYASFFESFVPPDGIRFDTVVATHVLEHVHDPVRVLQQARLWLKTGGRIVVVVPNATSLHRRIGVKMGRLKSVYDLSERDHAIGHQRVFDAPQLEAAVADAGFGVVHRQGFLLKTVSVAQMVDYPPELVTALFDVADELPMDMAADLALVIEPR